MEEQCQVGCCRFAATPSKTRCKGPQIDFTGAGYGVDGTRTKNDSEGILRVFLKLGKNALADGTAAASAGGAFMYSGKKYQQIP